MKKYLMIFGFALLTGVGIFALTDSMAQTNLLASVVPVMGCGCDTCGDECNCSADAMCGDAKCGCAQNGAMTSSCGASCSGGSTCGATTEGSCAAKSDSSATGTKTVGCGCSKHTQL